MTRPYFSSSRLFIGILILTLLVSGCKVGQNYRRPTVQLPEQYAERPLVDTSSVALMPWRQFFRDTDLQNLISTALTNNFDLQVAIKRIEENQAYVRQTRYALLPAVNGQVAASTVTPSRNSLNGLSLENFIGTRHLEDYSANLALSWEADIWGRIRRQNEATRAQFLQTEEAAKAVRTNLVASVATGYFNVLLLDAQLEIAKRNVALGDSIVRLIRLQKQSGDVTELAVQQAEAQRQNADLLRSQLEQALAIEQNGIRQLLGDWPGTIARSSRLATYPVADTLLTGVPAQLLANRPDVRVSELSLVAANARAGVAEASLYPALTITGSAGLNSFQASNWFALPNSLFYNLAAGLVQPIFQRRQLRTQLEVSQIQREAALVQFRQSLNTAVTDVSNALVRHEKVQEQERIATARAQTLQGAINNAKLLFKSGMATYLEVITAQSNALQAELAVADIKRQRLSAMVDVYRSLGGGWR
ncbi:MULTISPECIES: efflux transporter outer membrane subunit [unclassified Spirosoma]|uniref:efflux transporter outer membrane subunit n=1 Tax=unclassified Spirosoma TaxID=2621999 RepID=UPI00095BDF41|nr:MULTISPECIES: efflux transporter outer membrane subunit [unclassified Spirosoma]MBN8822659.1 efflux transporter outer membrane subunit [Spirosoma sp.]OJW74147.1 MAG: RND transporter [Spirosoma sp. 48-14]